MKTIDRLSERFTSSVVQAGTIALFRKCLYAFLFFRTITLLPAANEFWGPGSYLPFYYRQSSFLLKLLNPLQSEAFHAYYLFFAIAQLALIAISFFVKKRQRLLCAGIYFFTAALHHKMAAIENGGEQLAMILLFFLLLMNENGTGMLNSTVTNFAFLAARVQLVFVYFVAGITKLKGVHWIDGTALHYVFATDEY
ncbi:MAG TPA: hypothetical protein VFU15_08030, partial [Bacteroidia bacterium]|nr:hypothetical protein [Bacteroidia bacterium]